MVDEQRLPSGDDLIGEIERFLREGGTERPALAWLREYLESGDLLQYTDVVGGCFTPVVFSVRGASVRLTGSGLGCTDWPTCEEGRLAHQPDAVFLRDAGTRVVGRHDRLEVLQQVQRLQGFRADRPRMAQGFR